MAGEDVGGSVIDGDDSLDEWVDEKAEELGVSRRRLLERLGGDVDASAIEEEFLALAREFDDRLDATRDDLESEVDAAREEFDEKIDDVRDRVIQVKRETDEKAPGDHDHPDLREQSEDAAERADRLAEELASLSASVENLEATVDAGFDNYEDVLEFLTEATDDLDAKLRTLAEVTVALREQTKTLAARHAARSAADELAHLANRRGVERGKCGHCGESVHVGLLAAPRCPHCASTFSDVEPKRGFFGSARLVVGDPPALEGERAEWAVGSVTDAESVDPEGVLDDLLDDGEDE
ncbi:MULTISPECIES: hypothetical protein [Halorussus]|uniref:hypothetical protein n=1 Tax=Halorussus TaxID=1070314 RepID=UPI00209F3C70|nr:hypothetical protein [Halorussus vallis]USZ76950.1 hypothetical protein NGM07_06370 [Halorussus vallis]